MAKANYKLTCEEKEKHGDNLDYDVLIAQGWSWQSVGSMVAWLLSEGGYASVKVETISDEELARIREEQDATA